MKKKNATTYTLRTKGKIYNIGSATIKRLQTNQSVSTNTLDAICSILGCTISDVVEYLPDENHENENKSETETED